MSSQVTLMTQPSLCKGHYLETRAMNVRTEHNLTYKDLYN